MRRSASLGHDELTRTAGRERASSIDDSTRAVSPHHQTILGQTRPAVPTLSARALDALEQMRRAAFKLEQERRAYCALLEQSLAAPPTNASLTPRSIQRAQNAAEAIAQRRRSTDECDDEFKLTLEEAAKAIEIPGFDLAQERSRALQDAERELKRQEGQTIRGARFVGHASPPGTPANTLRSVKPPRPPNSLGRRKKRRSPIA